MAFKKPVGIVAELVPLLKTVTADGQMTDDEIAQVDEWLAAHPECNLPPLELLRATSAAIHANGPTSKEGRRAFHKAVEQVLPPEERGHSKAIRKARELAEQAKQKDERTADLTAKRVSKEKARADAASARERNRVVYRSNFLAAGTSHDNRFSSIRAHLKEDQAVVLVREPRNKYDRYAIKVFAQNAGELHDVGYVPREITPTLAPLMDLPHIYIATCTKILEGDRLIPVIDLVLYGPDADIHQPKPEFSKPAKPAGTWAELEAAAQVTMQATPATPCPIREVAPISQCRDRQEFKLKPILFWAVLIVLVVILGIALRAGA